nr:hypothetical protein [Corynebacterium heidelbergense]
MCWGGRGARMASGKISFHPEERILAELSPTRRSVLFPVLELLLVTALVWMGIGLVDRYLASPEAMTEAAMWVRRLLLVAWAWLAWRRSLRFLLFRARTRIVLTDQRLLTASGHLRSWVSEIPLAHVVDARRRGSNVVVYVMGTHHPVVVQDVPHTKRFVSLLRQACGGVMMTNRDQR